MSQLKHLNKDIYTRLIAAKRFMDDHYCAPLNLDLIAQRALLSRFHFHRLFCRVYRKTPHRYLTQKRMDKAKDLLAQDTPVSEVCTELGFESPASFSLLFKKEEGYAPQQYRNLALQKKAMAKQQPRMVIPHCFIETCKLE